MSGKRFATVALALLLSAGAYWALRPTPVAGKVPLKLWHAYRGGEEQATLKGHEDEVFCLAFSPNGKSLATGSADWTVRLWNLEKRTEPAVLKGHQGGVKTLAF